MLVYWRVTVFPFKAFENTIIQLRNLVEEILLDCCKAKQQDVAEKP